MKNLKICICGGFTFSQQHFSLRLPSHLLLRLYQITTNCPHFYPYPTLTGSDDETHRGKIKEKGFYLFMIKCQIMRRLIQSSIDLIDSNIVDISTIERSR